MEYDIRNPVWFNANIINVTWNHPRYGLVPYSCGNNSGEEEMQTIWDNIMAGEYGPIAGQP